MPANKYALLRYRVIDRCIRNKYKPYPSKKDLVQACSQALYGDNSAVGESTIEKDLWAMRFESELGYNAPIKFSMANKGYYYTDKEYTLDQIPLKTEDLNALRFAASTLQQFSELAPFQQFGEAMEKLLERLDMSGEWNGEESGRFIQFEMAPRYQGSKWLPELLRAAQEHLVVHFSYRKFGAAQPRNYQVAPRMLKEYRNRWYLIGWNLRKGSIATFGVERIQDLEITTEQAAPGDEFDAELYFKHCYGITSGSGIPEEVELRFEPVTAEYVKSQPLHASQEVVEDTPEGTVVRLTVFISYELIADLLRYGPDVEVLKPAHLKDTIRRTFHEALRKYSK